MEGLWRGWRFAMIDIKKLQIIFKCGMIILPSNGNPCVLLTFKNFQLVLLFQMPSSIIEYLIRFTRYIYRCLHLKLNELITFKLFFVQKSLN